MRARRVLALVAVGALASPLAPLAVAQMPDVRQMSGIPMPSPDLPAGSVSVRLVRGELINNITGHPVELHIGGKVLTSNTDDSGRAQFVGVTPATDLQVAAVVDGERIESQRFQVPPASGIRMILVAEASAPGSLGPARDQPTPLGSAAVGDVAFGGQSRIQIEFDDDVVEVFYLFEIVNAGSTPITPKSELVLELPEGAQQPAMLEGSTTQGTVRGRQVSIVGPFAPGVTPIQLAYGLAPAGAKRTVTQIFPVGWLNPQVLVTKVGNASMTSPQLSSVTEMPGDPHGVLMGTGPALPASRSLTIVLSGLPTRSHTGRYAGLILAALILGVGVWSAATARGASGDAARRTELMERRDRLMTELVRVETARRGSTADDPRSVARYNDLLVQLERVYGELDQQRGPSGQGHAA